ncbi:SDR family oxidoreductase [Roseiarcaceae bacterium H3SJ34-1]|uniref:SDR family NAD(P)-dependent oxidoreductase n=1 Tax=Terripilifer ovatus TaxID=3032367 RepID=UPI003AB98990|nr:SDR family oxidoreductase [Roseiarcaceae bacterium H3SJ34-1]
MSVSDISALDPLAAGGKRLQGKVCIVTGAGQGIGRASARRLAAEGGIIVVAERNESSAQETFEQLTNAGVKALKVIVDLSKFEEAERLMQETVAAFGRIDVIANVVGGTIWWQPFQEYTVDQIFLELERSLYTTLWCCKAVLPYMIEQKSGSIINFGSSVTAGGLYRVPYAVSKGGIVALTTTLAAENGRYGIRVNGVTPGTTIITDRTTSRLTLRPGEVADAIAGTDSRVEETRALQQGALRRTGRAEEQAAAVAFLASEDASFITGHMIDVSGGSH